MTAKKSSKKRRVEVEDAEDGEERNEKEQEQEQEDEKVQLHMFSSVIMSKELTLVKERMQKKWKAVVYAFYHPEPNITYTDDCRVDEFRCMNKGCKYKCRRFLDNNLTSTGNVTFVRDLLTQG